MWKIHSYCIALHYRWGIYINLYFANSTEISSGFWSQNRAKGARPQFAGLPPCTRISFSKRRQCNSQIGQIWIYLIVWFEEASQAHLEFQSTKPIQMIEWESKIWNNIQVWLKVSWIILSPSYLKQRSHLPKLLIIYFRKIFNERSTFDECAWQIQFLQWFWWTWHIIRIFLFFTRDDIPIKHHSKNSSIFSVLSITVSISVKVSKSWFKSFLWPPETMRAFLYYSFGNCLSKCEVCFQSFWQKSGLSQLLKSSVRKRFNERSMKPLHKGIKASFV